MRNLLAIALIALSLSACDQAQPAGGGAGLSSTPGVPSAPSTPSVPVPSAVPGLNSGLPSAAPSVTDTPQAVMEKAEVARNACDWTTYVSLLTPETHERLIMQQLHMHLMAAWAHEETLKKLGDQLNIPKENQPLKFAVDYWSKKGLEANKIREVAMMPKSPERTAELKALAAQVPNKQAFATELWATDAIKRGFRPRRPGEKQEVQVSGHIGNVRIEGDRAYVMAHASVNGSSMQHETVLHLTPLGWKIDLSKYYAIALDE